MAVRGAAAVKQPAAVKPVQGLIRLGPRIETRADSGPGLGSGSKTGSPQVRPRSSQRSIFSGLRLPLDTPAQVDRANNETAAKRDPLAGYNSNGSSETQPSSTLLEKMTERINQDGTTPRLVATYDGGAVYEVGAKYAYKVWPELEDAVFHFIEQNPTAWFPLELNMRHLRKSAIYFSRDRNNRITAFATVRFGKRSRSKLSTGGTELRGYIGYLEGFSPGATHVLGGLLSDMQKVDPAATHRSLRATDYRNGAFNQAWGALVKAKLEAGLEEEKIMGTPQFDALQKTYDFARVDMLRQAWLKQVKAEDQWVRGWDGPADPAPYPESYADERRKRLAFFEERANRLWSDSEPEIQPIH